MCALHACEQSPMVIYPSTEVHILYPKNPNFRICLPKKNPTFFSIPKKIPQCFCISKFYYLSSGKLKHANFNFGFGQKQNYKLRLCYFWFELMKNTIPKKIPLLFSRPQKIPASFIDQKKSFRPPPPPRPSLKYMSGAPGHRTSIWTLTQFMWKDFEFFSFFFCTWNNSQRLWNKD